MKPSLIKESVNQSWQVYHKNVKAYSFRWHCHEECEVFVPIHGQGECLVGDYQGTYHPGEVYFLPPFVPHCFYTIENNSATSDQESYVLFFRPGSPLLAALSEHVDISSLIARCDGGMLFRGNTCLTTSIGYCSQSDGLLAAGAFIQTLSHLLSLNGGRRLSHIAVPARRPTARSDHRMDRIVSYLHQYRNKQLTIAQVAAASDMSPQSLCRFFRHHTGKTVMDYLQELRINCICRQLVQSDRPITELALNGGFQTISHFNRTFKTLKGIAPREYRKRSHAATSAVHSEPSAPVSASQSQ